MRAHHMTHFFFLSLLLSFLLQFTASVAGFPDFVGDSTHRRILHQPLFPANSAPPPQVGSSLSPPSPDSPVFPNPDQPFFPGVPAGPKPNQAQPPPPLANGTAVPNPIATQPTKPAKKVAIAISVGIVTLGMLSGLAFYLYKHRAKNPVESRKLVGGNSQNLQEESRIPPSTFLYIGTVEPSGRRSASDVSVPNGSPYRKLNSVKRSDRYRPSPDLQPLPPLPKPPLPTMNSPPPMSSSDEESHETVFYTPQGSSVGRDEGSYTHGSRHGGTGSSNGTSLVTQPKAQSDVVSAFPHSKRTSPKSRLSLSSPDAKHALIPSSIKTAPPSPPPPPPPPPHSQVRTQIRDNQLPGSFSPKRPKFSAPPPPPNMARLQSIINKSAIPAPPPPPPSMERRLSCPEPTVRFIPSQDMPKSQSTIGNSKGIYGAEKTRAVQQVSDRGGSSSERIGTDDTEASKPKLKPLHWDKVRAPSDRATVWDQLKSSSFQ